MGLSDDDPVYTLKNVMEELDFSGLLACYSDKGRTGFNPIMLYAVVTYADMRGVRVIDRMVDLCQRDLAFIWLTKGQKPQRDVFYDFKGKKLTGEVLDELNYQFMRRLEKEGLISLKELYIDGTKVILPVCWTRSMLFTQSIIHFCLKTDMAPNTISEMPGCL